jgi:hypothetical protein
MIAPVKISHLIKIPFMSFLHGFYSLRINRVTPAVRGRLITGCCPKTLPADFKIPHYGLKRAREKKNFLDSIWATAR